MSDFKSFLEEQMKSEEFRREFEALAPDYEFVLRGDVDPRNLTFPIKMDGTEYTEYERGYNDGVIAAYHLTRQARKMEVEPVVHAHWVDRYGYKYANRLYVCSRCGKKALYVVERDVLGHEQVVQSFTDRCPECGAHMDERYPNV